MTDQKKIVSDFIQSIEKTITDFSMLSPRDTVLAGVSGGSDSVALVLSLLALQQTYHLTIGIAHINHQLREDDADRDEQFVRDVAQQFSLPFFSEEVDVAAYAKTHKLSIETAGRRIRYQFFEKTAKKYGYTRIATGHHKDDNAEVVLINLLRGSGPKGLCGIPPVRDTRFIRPLIRMNKTQILEFLGAKNQDFMEDVSNADPRYLRNKIRNQLIPHLESEYNPEIIPALDRLSHILRQEEIFWEKKTQKALAVCLIYQETAYLVLSKPAMKSLEPALLNRVLRMAIEAVKGDLKRISHAHVEEGMMFCFSASTGKSLDLPGQIRIYKTTDTIEIRKEDKPLRDIGKALKLKRRSRHRKEGGKP